MNVIRSARFRLPLSARAAYVRRALCHCSLSQERDSSYRDLCLPISLSLGEYFVLSEPTLGILDNPVALVASGSTSNAPVVLSSFRDRTPSHYNKRYLPWPAYHILTRTGIYAMTNQFLMMMLLKPMTVRLTFRWPLRWDSCPLLTATDPSAL